MLGENAHYNIAVNQYRNRSNAEDVMKPVKVGTSWRIQNEWGSFEGWYMTEAQALKGIAKRIRDRNQNTK